jgi:hypothetical protein
VARLQALIESDADPGARAAAVSALDGIDDAHAVDPALFALQAVEPEIVIAALAVLGGWVAREDGTRVLEALTAVALQKERDPRIRLAALDALSDLPRQLVQPIVERAPTSSEAGAFDDDPLRVREWLASEGDRAALSALHDLVVRIRERERAESSARRRQDWLTVRGAVHATLAHRGSRVALYDLREAFDAAQGPLPLDFLTAVTAIGDGTCLEPMARAWAASPHEAWWRERLADAAADIMRRTRLTRRSAVVKRIRNKWTGFI